MKHLQPHLKKAGIQILGFACLFLGVAGLILPVLNGVFFILLGLVLLSIHSAFARSLLRKMGKQHPLAEKWIIKAERFVFKLVGELGT